MKLSELTPAPGSSKKRKRVGRGDGSGHGDGQGPEDGRQVEGRGQTEARQRPQIFAARLVREAIMQIGEARS